MQETCGLVHNTRNNGDMTGLTKFFSSRPFIVKHTFDGLIYINLFTIDNIKTLFKNMC